MSQGMGGACQSTPGAEEPGQCLETALGKGVSGEVRVKCTKQEDPAGHHQDGSDQCKGLPMCHELKNQSESSTSIMAAMPKIAK